MQLNFLWECDSRGAVLPMEDNRVLLPALHKPQLPEHQPTSRESKLLENPALWAPLSVHGCRGACKERKVPEPLCEPSSDEGRLGAPWREQDVSPTAQSAWLQELVAGVSSVVSSLAGELSRSQVRLLTSLSNFPTLPAPKAET